MSKLELKVPPVIVASAVAGLMWLASIVTPSLVVPRTVRLVVLLGLLGVALALISAAAIAFRRAGTTVDPTDPEGSSSLVTNGVYRFTRNPMYLAMLLALLGFALWLANPLALVIAVTFVAYMDRFQIRPEERVLAAHFGRDYDSYRAKVRRWA